MWKYRILNRRGTNRSLLSRCFAWGILMENSHIHINQKCIERIFVPQEDVEDGYVAM